MPARHDLGTSRLNILGVGPSTSRDFNAARLKTLRKRRRRPRCSTFSLSLAQEPPAQTCQRRRGRTVGGGSRMVRSKARPARPRRLGGGATHAATCLATPARPVNTPVPPSMAVGKVQK